MTIGEFARMAAAEKKIGVALAVVPLEGWTRGRWYDDTGLPWTNPSPNIRSVTQALLYSGIGLLEATNLSVGRGTDTPFEVVGAPWIEPAGLAQALRFRCRNPCQRSGSRRRRVMRASPAAACASSSPTARRCAR
jgi:uncharacterized protein YbbC (DUF1343 family)